jgi:hypothetical protein
VSDPGHRLVFHGSAKEKIQLCRTFLRHFLRKRVTGKLEFVLRRSSKVAALDDAVPKSHFGKLEHRLAVASSCDLLARSCANRTLGDNGFAPMTETEFGAPLTVK